jgi:DNA-binding PadR family transcriptional regulator
MRRARGRSTPPCQLLEDLGYTRIVPGDEGKKVYEITDAGRAQLAENQSTVDNIFDRISQARRALPGRAHDRGPRRVPQRRARHLRARDGSRARSELLKKVAEILERAAKEIEGLPR